MTEQELKVIRDRNQERDGIAARDVNALLEYISTLQEKCDRHRDQQIDHRRVARLLRVATQLCHAVDMALRMPPEVKEAAARLAKTCTIYVERAPCDQSASPELVGSSSSETTDEC